MAKPRRAQPAHLPSWFRPAVTGGVAAVVALVAALAGGFAERVYQMTTLVAGETADLGPMRFTPVRATIERPEGSGQVEVRIEGYCLNETDAPLALDSGFLDQAVLVFDPATKAQADSVHIYIGPWDKPGTYFAFNPLGHDVECAIAAEFFNGFVADQVRLGAALTVPDTYLLNLEEGDPWIWDQNAGPTQYYLPLVPK